MDYELVLENSSTTTAYTMANTIIYFKTVKYWNTTLRDVLHKPGTSCCTMVLRIWDYCVGNQKRCVSGGSYFLKAYDSTSGQKQLTIFTVCGTHRK